jgi:hypothetical protein
MRHDLSDVHDIGVFVMQVEQIDLVGELGPIERAFTTSETWKPLE